MTFRNACDLSEMRRIHVTIDTICQNEFQITSTADVSNAIRVKFTKPKPFKVHSTSVKTISCKVLWALSLLNLGPAVAGRGRFSFYIANLATAGAVWSPLQLARSSASSSSRLVDE